MSEELAGMDELTLVMEGILGLAARGTKPSDYQRFLGVDPDALKQAASEAADEEFDTLPGLPSGVPAGGRLRKLSANQRALVKEALTDTYALAFMTGATLVAARAREEKA